MPVAATLDYTGFRSAMNALANGLARTDFKDALKACAVVLRNDLRQNVQAGRSPDGTVFLPLKHPRPNGKTSPLWDTGALVRSLGAGTGHVERIDKTSLEIGTSMEYASLQQFGGTVTPKKGKFLTIPLTMAAKRAGSPRNFPGGLRPIINKRKGTGVLIGAKIQQRGKNKGKVGKIEAQYALVKKVVVPPRPFVGFSPKASTEIDRILTNAVLGVP